ncbi:hypothetical protein TNCT_161051 [Trichonephila clavata]|uniref:Uncharacterized protein n=1 Tax=Trichonephila clavata TaxID=2740835 RepID=A0A8X6LFL5_TRICU|nr:hypothetical protein TNCT_161051 [Trichonephila clavata]
MNPEDKEPRRISPIRLPRNNKCGFGRRKEEVHFGSRSPPSTVVVQDVRASPPKRTEYFIGLRPSAWFFWRFVAQSDFYRRQDD